MLRAVVDPNVLISSRISDLGHPARIARAADEGCFELILSERLLGELSEVLMRPRFRRYATEEEVEDSSSGCTKRETSSKTSRPSDWCPTTPRTITWWH